MRHGEAFADLNAVGGKRWPLSMQEDRWLDEVMAGTIHPIPAIRCLPNIHSLWHYGRNYIRNLRGPAQAAIFYNIGQTMIRDLVCLIYTIPSSPFGSPSGWDLEARVCKYCFFFHWACILPLGIRRWVVLVLVVHTAQPCPFQPGYKSWRPIGNCTNILNSILRVQTYNYKYWLDHWKLMNSTPGCNHSLGEFVRAETERHTRIQVLVLSASSPSSSPSSLSCCDRKDLKSWINDSDRIG